MSDAADSMRRVLVPFDISPQAPAVGAHVHALQGLTMGTTWSVKLVAGPDQVLTALQTGIQQQLDAVVAQMSTWDAASDLSRYNQAAAGTWQPVPAEFFHVLRHALEMAQVSDGAYDPTAGPLVNAWGFGPEQPLPPRPDTATLAAARARVGWRQVQIDTARQCVLQPGSVYLDLSAIAKGFGVDQVSRYLHGRGIASHLVEVGGELRGAGIKPDALPWWVALEQPLTHQAAVDPPATLVALHNLSVATSGDYRRYFDDAEGTRYSHTIDPRSGAPIRHGLAAVTVLHRDCMTADAISTALNVMGVAQGMAFAQTFSIAARFVLRTPDGCTEHLTPAFKALCNDY